MEQAAKFEGDMRVALEELEKKHAFERGWVGKKPP
jgi:hypothetical protein